MLIDPTDTPMPGSGPGTALPTTIDKGQISKDYDMFLRLMTAQLKNQDPLQPLDGTEFVAQLAQFSGVEQQIKTNERLDTLLGALTRSAAEVSLGFLGRTVETASSKVHLEAGAPASFAFEVQKPAAKAVAVVTDADGVEVRKFDVDANTLGRREAVWDGHDGTGNPGLARRVHDPRPDLRRCGQEGDRGAAGAGAGEGGRGQDRRRHQHAGSEHGRRDRAVRPARDRRLGHPSSSSGSRDPGPAVAKKSIGDQELSHDRGERHRRPFSGGGGGILAFTPASA